jgi:hypothetical protein
MCAEASRFWTTGGAGDGASTYTAANFAQFVRETFLTAPASEGVLYGIGNNLAVSGATSPVAVNTGSALVYGIFYTNDASVNVTIATPASSTRVDVIVLRVSWAAQTVRITRVAGTEGAGVPAITQVANTTWDIPLANVSITTGGAITLTDRRTYVKHPGVYGWLQQANTWTGNQTVTGNVTATQLGVDANAYINITSSNPLFNMDANDYMQYNRSSNQFEFYVGSSLIGAIAAGGWSASGLNASQLTSGTVPLARLSGITTTQLSGTAGITDAQIAALDAAKITSGTLPLARLSGIVDAQVSGLSASKINAGRFDTARLPIQSGVFTAAASASGQTITFPVAFSSAPVVVANANGDVNIVSVTATSTTTATIIVRDRNGSYNGGSVNWIAIGPM